MVRSIEARAKLALAFWMLLAVGGSSPTAYRAGDRAFAFGVRPQS